MRIFISLVFTIFIFGSCANKQNQKLDEPRAQKDSLREIFAPVLKGVWVLTDYINEIEKTKSPLKASSKLQNIVSMSFDGTNTEDSIVVNCSWNNHEGYTFSAYFVNGLSSNSIKTDIIDYENKSNFYELAYETILNKTVLLIKHYNKANRLLDQKEFTEVLGRQRSNDLANGIQYIVNRKLFSGNYTLIDSTEARTKINLKDDGSLSGFSDFKTFDVYTDFVVAADAAIDEICFDINTKNAHTFGFQIKSDTIYLYSTTGDGDPGGIPLKFDKIKYKLVKR